MTDPNKSYWIRRVGTVGQPGWPTGELLRKKRPGVYVWTLKRAAATAFAGGPELDKCVERNPDYELVEVEQSGTTSYHRRQFVKWVPVNE